MQDTTTSETTAPATGDDKYAEALRRFGTAGDSRMAQQVIDSMVDRDVPIEPHHNELLLQAYLSANDLPNALRIAAKMRADGHQLAEPARFDLAFAAARVGRTRDAEAIVDDLEAAGYRAGQQDAPRAFSLFVKLGRLPIARSLLKSLAEQGHVATADEYGILLADCLERRAIKDTRQVIDGMIAAGAPPKPEQATALVAMMARAGHADRARELRDVLRGAGVTVGGDAWEALVRAAERSDEAGAVEATITEMAQAGITPTSHHRNTLLASACAAKDVDRTIEVLDGLVDDGVIPTGENLEAAFDLVLPTSIDRARQVLDWMVILGVPVPAAKVAALVAALLKAGDLDAAVTVFDEALALGIPGDRKQGSGVLHELLRANRLDDARDFLQRARKARVLTHGRHHGALVAAFVRADRLDEGLTLLDKALARKAAPSSGDASKIVAAVLRTGDLDRTRKLIDSLAAVDVTVDEASYRELLWAYAKKRQVEPAQAVFDRLVAAGITPDDRHEAAMRWAKGETAQNLEEARAAAEAAVAALTEANLANFTSEEAADDATETAAEAVAPEGPAEPEPEPEPVAVAEPEPVVEPEREPEPVAAAEPDVVDADVVEAEVVDDEVVDAEVFDDEVVDAEVVDDEVVDAEVVDAEVVEAEPTPAPTPAPPPPSPSPAPMAEDEAKPPTAQVPASAPSVPAPAPDPAVEDADEDADEDEADRKPSQAPPLLRDRQKDF